MTRSAPADPPRYRVIDIAPLGEYFHPNVDSHGLMGINGCGEVVYGRHFVNSQAEPPVDEHHAWVWLPATKHGIAAGWHDLMDLASGDGYGIARDINDSGLIVGQSPEPTYDSAPYTRACA